MEDIGPRLFKPTIGALVALALISSLTSRVPAVLPEVALGSTLLLHAERAAVLLAIVGGTWLIAVRASRGEYPDRFAQIAYESATAKRDEERALKLDERIRNLERLAGLRSNGNLEGNGDGI